MAVPSAPGDTGLTSNPHDRTPSPKVRFLLLCGLVVLLVASTAVLVWLVADHRGEADEVQSQREDVMAQARQLVLRIGTYGPDLLEGQGRCRSTASRSPS